MSTTLTDSQKYIARIILSLRIHDSNGSAYQDLFVKIMGYSNPNFRTVKPHGNIGDRKNDGFDNVKGIYYQVYAPITIVEKDADIAKKIKADFKGLMKHWSDTKTGVVEWYFVLNDKFLGVSPNIEKSISVIQKKHTTVKSDLFLAKDLVVVFMDLYLDQIQDVLGGLLPSLDVVGDVDFEVLRSVIKFLLDAPFDYKQESIPLNPDFEEKIQFNNLSDKVGHLLIQGNYQSHVIKDYFKLNGSYEKDRLRIIFSNHYLKSSESFKTESDKADLIFFDILEKASPNNTLPVQNAVIILMSYFFEYCDIYEIPT